MTKYHRYILLLLAIVPAIAAPRDKADGPAFRPAAVSPVLKSEMARYSLKAYENRDQTNAVKAGGLGSDTVGGVVSGGVHSYLIYYAA